MGCSGLKPELIKKSMDATEEMIEDDKIQQDLKLLSRLLIFQG